MCASRIFTKLGHIIPLWEGKNPMYVGVIRSKVKVTVTINRILTTWSFPHYNFSSVYPPPTARHAQSHNTARLETVV
jgi:hypothetical protein